MLKPLAIAIALVVVSGAVWAESNFTARWELNRKVDPMTDKVHLSAILQGRVTQSPQVPASVIFEFSCSRAKGGEWEYSTTFNMLNERLPVQGMYRFSYRIDSREPVIVDAPVLRQRFHWSGREALDMMQMFANAGRFAVMTPGAGYPISFEPVAAQPSTGKDFFAFVGECAPNARHAATR